MGSSNNYQINVIPQSRSFDTVSIFGIGILNIFMQVVALWCF